MDKSLEHVEHWFDLITSAFARPLSRRKLAQIVFRGAGAAFLTGVGIRTASAAPVSDPETLPLALNDECAPGQSIPTCDQFCDFGRCWDACLFGPHPPDGNDCETCQEFPCTYGPQPCKPIANPDGQGFEMTCIGKNVGVTAYTCNFTTTYQQQHVCPGTSVCCETVNNVYCCPPSQSCNDNGCCVKPSSSGPMYNTTTGVVTFRFVDTSPLTAFCDASSNVGAVQPNTTFCTISNGPNGPRTVAVCSARLTSGTTGKIGCWATNSQGCSAVADPVITTLSLSTGHWISQTFDGIVASDHILVVSNADPGFVSLRIEINGHVAGSLQLERNGTKVVDLAQFMTTKENSITFVGFGRLGSSATLQLGDTVPADDVLTNLHLETRRGARPSSEFPDAPNRRFRQEAIWGKLRTHAEHLGEQHAVNLADQSVEISFASPLDPASASLPINFDVEVNHQRVDVVNAVYKESSITSSTLYLMLPSGALNVGNEVMVYWDTLKDSNGEYISGTVGPLHARMIH